MRTVLIVAPPHATLQDVTGPYEVFCRAETYAPGTYGVSVVSADDGLTVRSKFGLGILAQGSVHDHDGPLDTVLVAGSEQGVSGAADPRFIAWLVEAEGRVRRLGSVCTGAFYLARAGLLAGRRATTHWRYLRALSDAFPDVRVEPDPIFVHDGVYTSAGITAGIDLALALVEEDLGPGVAHAVARDLVVFVQRPPSQPQLSAALGQRIGDRDAIRRVQAWAPDHLERVATVDDLAAVAGMSPRNFAREFKRQTGSTPGTYLRALRVEAAERRLKETGGKAKLVAAQVGFGSVQAMRRSLRSG